LNDALAYTGVAIVSSEIIGLAPGNKGKSNLSRSFSEELDYDLGALTLGAGPANHKSKFIIPMLKQLSSLITISAKCAWVLLAQWAVF
jgi:hypothetical protein